MYDLAGYTSDKPIIGHPRYTKNKLNSLPLLPQKQIDPNLGTAYSHSHEKMRYMLRIALGRNTTVCLQLG